MIHKPKIWFWISLGTITISLIVIVGLRPTLGIDFTGGSLLEIAVPAEIEITEAAGRARGFFQGEADLTATVQTTQEGTLLIRTTPLDETQHQAVVEKLREVEVLGEELRFESIGPTIGNELRRKSITAGLVAIVAMIGYLTYTFRQTSGLIAPWKFGVAATYALVHDIVVVTALFVGLGRLYQVPIDTLFVTAMLAIAGYSVNDTVVIFNRFRQEWLVMRQAGLVEVIRRALRLSLTRSINTSLTTVLVLLALLIFGGATIQWFVLALLMGTIVGTYSSLFVAPPLLVVLTKES